MTWDPEQYLRFDDLRRRPALDLLARIPSIRAEDVWDLGCGTGEITRALAAKWPGAIVHGLDSSPEMLDRARQDEDTIDWVSGDIAEWRPTRPPDVVFSNAALHWLPDHEELLPRLFSSLRPAGVLAVQMPRNHGEPSHRTLHELARKDKWAPKVAHLVRDEPVADPADYHRLLSSRAGSVDVWETVYQQALSGPDAIAEWVKGSVLRPYLEELGPDGDAFLADYATALRAHYPMSADGTTLFPFRRVFMVARR